MGVFSDGAFLWVLKENHGNHGSHALCLGRRPKRNPSSARDRPVHGRRSSRRLDSFPKELEETKRKHGETPITNQNCMGKPKGVVCGELCPPTTLEGSPLKIMGRRSKNLAAWTN